MESLRDGKIIISVALLLRCSVTSLLRRSSAPILCFVIPLQSLGTIEVSLVKFDRQAQEM
jgi:hypothetical protein